MTRDFYGFLPFLQERLGYVTDDTGFESWQTRKFLLSISSQTGSRAKMNGYQVKRPERKVLHFQLSSVEVKNERNYTSFPTICFSGLYRNKFIFYLDIRCTLFLYFLFFLKNHKYFSLPLSLSFDRNC